MARTVTVSRADGTCGCVTPDTCCMYPWPNTDHLLPGDPLYPHTDLPATININGVTMDYDPGGAGPYDAGGYRFTLAGSFPIQFVSLNFEGGSPRNWKYIDGDNNLWDSSAFGGGCLISTFNKGLDETELTDNFNDTYTVHLDDFSETLTRISKCSWRGPVEEGAYQLDYLYATSSIPDWYAGPGWYLHRGDSVIGKNMGSQSSPIGTYQTGGEFIT